VITLVMFCPLAPISWMRGATLTAESP